MRSTGGCNAFSSATPFGTSESSSRCTIVDSTVKYVSFFSSSLFISSSYCAFSGVVCMCTAQCKFRAIARVAHVLGLLLCVAVLLETYGSGMHASGINI